MSNLEKIPDDKIDAELAVKPLDVALDAHVLSAFIKWAGSNLEQFTRTYLSVRQHYCKIFRNRFPNSRIFAKYSSTAVAPFTKSSNPNWIIIGCWQTDDNVSKFNIFQQIKMIFTELDILLKEDAIADKKIVTIFDMENFTRMHFETITRYAAHVIGKIAESAIPGEVGAVYIINAPDWVSEYTELFPSFNFHIMKSPDDLIGFVPKDILPCDMGGEEDAPNRMEFEKMFKERLCLYSGWLAQEEQMWEMSLLTDSIDKCKKKGKRKG